jgi:hypothetical protein
MKEPRISKPQSILTCLSFVLSLASCGGSSVTGPSQTVIAQGTCSPLASGDFCTAPFTTSHAGRVDITVDWSLPQWAIDVVVAPQGACTLGQVRSNNCNAVIGETLLSNTPKPRLLTLDGLAAGSYSMYIFNGGAESYSASFLVTLTT